MLAITTLSPVNHSRLKKQQDPKQNKGIYYLHHVLKVK